MNPRAPKLNEELNFITKCEKIAASKGLQFSASSFPETNPQLFNQMLKDYSEKQMFLGETTAENYLQKALLSVSAKLKSQKFSEKSVINSLNRGQEKQVKLVGPELFQPKVSQETTKQIIIKESRQEYQQQIYIRWRNARYDFFKNRTKGPQNQSDQLLLQKIDSQFRERLRRCSSIQMILQSKIKSLRSIYIEHEARVNRGKQRYHYQVSAFDLFKVIHQNQQLKQVTLKGMVVKNFQYFLRYLRSYSLNLVSISNPQLSWIKGFVIPKHLKLLISVELFWKVKEKQQTQLQIKDLQFYAEMVGELSNIAVTIVLGEWSQVFKWAKTLKDVLGYLKNVRHIAIFFEKQEKSQQNESIDCIDASSITTVRSVLFGQLAQFTHIVELSFKKISFDPNLFGINDYMAIEQILSTIFSKNRITHLFISDCEQFPAFPQITSLQSIDYLFRNIRKQILFISSIVQTNYQLKSIIIRHTSQEWMIDDLLLRQLQRLSVTGCSNFKLDKISHFEPYPIKYLSLEQSSIQTSECSLLFSKLTELIYLRLEGFNFGSHVICSIPSPFLQEIIIESNNQLTNYGLLAINKKWPQLKKLRMNNCKKITEQAWTMCEFKGLILLRADKQNFGAESKAIMYLQRRGIVVIT